MPMLMHHRRSRTNFASAVVAEQKYHQLTTVSAFELVTRTPLLWFVEPKPVLVAMYHLLIASFAFELVGMYHLHLMIAKSVLELAMSSNSHYFVIAAGNLRKGCCINCRVNLDHRSFNFQNCQTGFV